MGSYVKRWIEQKIERFTQVV